MNLHSGVGAAVKSQVTAFLHCFRAATRPIDD